MIYWAVITLVSGFLYFLVSLWLSSGLKNVKIKPDNSNGELPKVSILVAARNEEESLPILFESLQKQSYPVDKIQIFVINDRSEDATANVVNRYRNEMKNLNLIEIDSVPDGIAPKKNAISRGVELSDGEIIVITDADCIVPKQWIEEIVSHFSNSKVGLVQGLTGYPKERSKTILDRFQRLDFFSHSVVAAAGIGKNLPINSNANNFSYRRSIFETLEGYGSVAKVVSGDDDLLLQRVWESGEWEIKYMGSSSSAVVTEPVSTFRDMLEQRKRWGSKTVYYKPRQTVTLSLIFLFYIVTFSTMILSPFSLEMFLLFSVLLGIKISGELLFLIPGTSLFNEQKMRIDILWASPLQLILVIYSVLGGVLGSFTWKGKKYKRTV